MRARGGAGGGPSAGGATAVLWAVDYLGHGGIGRYAVDLVNAVGDAGGLVEAVVATTDRGPVEGLRGRSAVWFPRGSDSALAKVRAAVVGLVRGRRSVRRGDVAWVPLGIRPVYELLLVLVLRSTGALVVATVHNRAPHGTRGGSAVLVATARLAGRVVVHTGALEQWGRERGMRVEPLPFLVPDLAPSAGPPPTRAELGVPDGHLLLAFLGYLLPYKGPDVLLRALALARAERPDLPVHVLLAGRPSPELDLAALTRELGVAEATTLRLGWLEEAEMSALFDAADAIALPHRRIDNSGVTAVARRRGLPAVASDLPLLRETYAGAALFARPGDEADLARCLGALPERRAELAAAAAHRPEDTTEAAYRGFLRRVVLGGSA